MTRGGGRSPVGEAVIYSPPISIPFLGNKGWKEAFLKRRCLLGIIVLAVVLFVPAFSQDKAGALSDLARIQKGRSAAVTSSEPDFRSNLDRVTYIHPGETLVMADIQESGIIQHIWLTFNEARPNWLEKDGSARPDEIVLRMYWDDADQLEGIGQNPNSKGMKLGLDSLRLRERWLRKRPSLRK